MEDPSALWSSALKVRRSNLYLVNSYIKFMIFLFYFFFLNNNYLFWIILHKKHQYMIFALLLLPRIACSPTNRPNIKYEDGWFHLLLPALCMCRLVCMSDVCFTFLFRFIYGYGLLDRRQRHQQATSQNEIVVFFWL